MSNFIKERQFCRNSAVLTVARGYCHNATYLRPGSLCGNEYHCSVERTFHYMNISVNIPAEIKAAGFTESYIEVL